MEKLENVNVILFENPVFKEEEQELKRKNELDSLSLSGLAIQMAGINYVNPGILSFATILNR